MRKLFDLNKKDCKLSKIDVLLNGGFGNLLFQTNYALNLKDKGYKTNLLFWGNFIDNLIRIGTHAQPNFDINPLKILKLDKKIEIKKFQKYFLFLSYFA